MAVAGDFVDSENSITVYLPTNPNANPTAQYSFRDITNHPVTSSPYPVGVNTHPLGGGLFTLTVESYHEVDVAGHAEWWAHDILTDLGSAGPGILTVNDQEWPDVMFSQGVCEIIRASSTAAAVYSLSFLTSRPKAVGLGAGSTSGSASSVGSRTNAGDYAFNSISIGAHAHISRVSVIRAPLVKHIPRASGVRVKDRRGGRRIVFELAAWVRKTGVGRQRKELEQELHNLFVQFDTDKASLVGQGNTFADCTLRSWSPRSEDFWWTAPVSVLFEQELGETSL